LQALRGIAHISAVTIAAELGEVSHFEGARQLMGFCGVVPSEDSSGKRTRRGSITKTGNAHLRRIVVEAAWSYHRPPAIWAGLRKRQQSVSEEAKEIACVEGTTPTAQAIRETGGQGQRQEKDRHSRRARIVGFHLGHRDQGGNDRHAERIAA